MPNWVRWLGTVLLLITAAVLWFMGTLLTLPPARIIWSTESEVETAGFHVYRAAQEAGPYTRVSTNLVPSCGDPFTGCEYEFNDPTVQADQTYYYQLEELETTGNFTRLPETVRHEAKRTPNWPVAFTLLGALALLWLLPGPRRRREPLLVEERIREVDPA